MCERRGPDATVPRRQASTLIRAGATMLATSVLLDSAMEHYRGGFRNRAMLTPLVTATIGVALNTRPGLGSGRSRASAQAVTALSGAAGLGFHVFAIFKRPGKLSWTNLFYAAPVGAPAALILAGSLGAAADALRAGEDHLGPITIASGRALAGFAAFGIAGTVGEAWLMHFRGAFQNPAMLLPVVLPPVAAIALARDAVLREPSPLTRKLLWATAALGVAGVAFHAYGISRAMGGWRNWRQNMVDGPPLPAPPAFTGLAIAALGALELMEKQRD